MQAPCLISLFSNLRTVLSLIFQEAAAALALFTCNFINGTWSLTHYWIHSPLSSTGNIPLTSQGLWIRTKDWSRLPKAAVYKARSQEQTAAAPSLALKVYTHTRLSITGSDGDIWLPVVFRCMKHATLGRKVECFSQ